MSEPDFDSIAPAYRLLEYLTLGSALEQCRTHFLPLLRHGKTALVLGDGDGRFLAALLGANPGVHATAVDTSAAMLRLLGTRCRPFAGRLSLLHQSALADLPGGPFDLLAAHFFFDCLAQSELDCLIPALARRATSDALWLVSDFRVPAGPLRVPATVFIRALYLGFRVLTGLRAEHLPDHEAALRRAGLTRAHQHLSLAGMLSTEVWMRASQL